MMNIPCDIQIIMVTVFISLLLIGIVLFVFNITGQYWAKKWTKEEFDLLEKFDVKKFLESKSDNNLFYSPFTRPLNSFS